MKERIKNLLVVMAMILALAVAVLCVAIDVSRETKEPHVSETTMENIEEIADEYGVCKWLIVAMCEAESSGNQTDVRGNVVRNGNCIGIMQVNEILYQERANDLGVSLYTEYGNLLVGTDLLMELAEEYEDLPVVLTAYNCGEYSDATKDAIETGIGKKYAEKIIKRTEQLERMAEKYEN